MALESHTNHIIRPTTLITFSWVEVESPYVTVSIGNTDELLNGFF